MNKITLTLAGVLTAATLAAPAAAEDFYEGKTVRIIIGFGTGGNYDIYGRLVAQYLGDHIPGKPNIIVQNMPGAGATVAANYLYNKAPRDGTVLGEINQNAHLGQLFKQKGVQYDERKFTWIGRMVSNTSVWSAWHTTKIKTADDLFKHEAVAGAGGPTSNSQIIPRMLNQFVGARFKIIDGYKNSGELDLAMQRGEIDGRTIPYGIYLKDKNVADGKVNAIVQFATERPSGLSNVPTAVELVKNTEQRQMVSLVLSGGVMGRSLMAPPGVPADRVEILRKAFDAAMKDPKLIALAEKTQNDLEPLTGAAVEKNVMGLFDVSADVAKKTADLIDSAKKKKK